MTIEQADRGRGAGAGAVHADRRLPARLRRLRRQAQAGVRRQLRWPHADAPRLAVLRAAPPRAGARHSTTGPRSTCRSTHGADVDAACRALVRALGAGRLAAARGGGDGRDRHARGLPDPRDAGAPRRPGRLRLRDAGPGQRRHRAGRRRRRRRERYLPRVARGEAIAAFALSEPDAGSDVAALACQRARRRRRLRARRREDLDLQRRHRRLLRRVRAHRRGAGARGISAFIVDADTPGLEIAERIEVIAPHPLARLRFDATAACRATQLLGAAGEGFKLAMRTLDVFRTSVAAAALGFARRALDEALAARHARAACSAACWPTSSSRRRALAQMATTHRQRGAAHLPRGVAARPGPHASRARRRWPRWPPPRARSRSSTARCSCSAASACVSGEPVERLYREIRALRIYEGATEVQQLIIARELLREASTALEPDMHQRPRRHLRARPPAAARAAGRSSCSTCPSCSSRRSSTAPAELLDRRVDRGPRRPPLRPRAAACAGPTPSCSSAPTASPTCWCDDMGVVPGNRVLLRAPNNPMLAACWFAVMKAGAIAVATMPLLRAKELDDDHRQGAGHARAVRRARWPTSCALAHRRSRPTLRSVRCFNGGDGDGPRSARCAPRPRRVRQRRHRGRRHLPDRLHLRHHRRAQGDDALPPRRDGDLRAAFRRTCCAPRADDVFIGSPPLAFTFGLGGLLLFPMSVGASTRAAREGRRPTRCSTASRAFGATVLLHRADVVPRAGRAWRRAARDASCASACPPARRCPRPRARCGSRRPASRSSTASARPRCCTSSSPPTRRTRAPARPARRCPGYARRVVDDDGQPAAAGQRRPARASRARPAAATSPTSASASYVQRRLELHRRRLPHGRRRLLPLPGAHRRHDHLGRLQHRRPGGRGRAAAASRGGRVRRRRRARRGARPDRQGLRRAARRPRGRRRAGARSCRTS